MRFKALQDVAGQAHGGFAIPVFDCQVIGMGVRRGRHQRTDANKSHGAGAQCSDAVAARKSDDNGFYRGFLLEGRVFWRWVIFRAKGRFLDFNS